MHIFQILLYRWSELDALEATDLIYMYFHWTVAEGLFASLTYYDYEMCVCNTLVLCFRQWLFFVSPAKHSGT